MTGSDPDGVVKYTNTYDDERRVTAQALPSGNTVHFGYQDSTGVTTATWSATGAVTTYAHDRNGRLTAITDAHGQIQTMAFDALGNLTQVIDRRTNNASATYDTHGNVLTTQQPGGVTTSNTYDSADRLTSATDGEGKTATFSYTGTDRIPSSTTDRAGAVSTQTVQNGLVTHAVDADGVAVTNTYDSLRQLRSVSDTAGHTTTFEYDTAGNKTVTRSPLAETTTVTYDADRRPTKVVSPMNETTRTTYTPAGRTSTVTDPTNVTTTTHYDAAGRATETIDAAGQSTTYTYDADDNIVQINKPGNAAAKATYDPMGRVDTMTDADGGVTTYTYDANGNPVGFTDPNGHTGSRTYDARNRISTETDGEAHTTTYTYDHDDRLVSTVDALGNAVTTSYDGEGRTVKTVDRRSNPWTRTFTPAGRLKTDADPLGGTTTYTYDALGLQATRSDPTGRTTTFTYDADHRRIGLRSETGISSSITYDADGRTTTTTDPTGGTTTSTWTARGQMASSADPAGGTKRWTYDAMGRVIDAADPNGNHTTYTYDGRGNVLTRTDPRGGISRYTWSAADRLVKSVDQLGRATTYTYDAAGQRTKITDPSGHKASIGYDKAGRPTTRVYAAPNQAFEILGFTYDADGRLLTATGPDGTTSQTWDPDGNPLVHTAADGQSITNTWDTANRRATLKYPDGTAVAYQYDAAGRPTSANGTVGPQFNLTWTYDRDGLLTSERSGATTARSWAYTSGRLATFTQTAPAASPSASSALTATTLDYDAASRITGTTTAGVRTSYAYDPAGQIKSLAVGGVQAAAYTYDGSGNRKTRTIAGRLASTYTYDAASELTSVADTVGTTTYTYDAAGREATSTGPQAVVTTAYDARGLVTSKDWRRTSTGSSLLRQTLTHDTTGETTKVTTQPASTTVGPITQTIAWDNTFDNPVAATLTRGSTISNQVWGPDGRDLTIVGQAALGTTTDVFGNQTLTPTNPLAGAPAYDTFGNPVTSVGTSVTDNSNLTAIPAVLGAAFGYRGELDINGLLDLRARDYNPTTTRFTTPDPLNQPGADPASSSDYAYAANDALNLVDPTGLSPTKDAKANLKSLLESIEAEQRHDHFAQSGWDTATDTAKVSTWMLAKLWGAGYTYDHNTWDNLTYADRAALYNKGYASPQAVACRETYGGIPLVGGIISWTCRNFVAIDIVLGIVAVAALAFVFAPAIAAAGSAIAEATAALGAGFSTGTLSGAIAGGYGAAAAILTSDPLGAVAQGGEAICAAVAGGQSFDGSTLITLADGSKKPISQVRIGDKVRSREAKSGRVVDSPVTRVWLHLDQRTLRLRVSDKSGGASNLITTPDHAIWTPSADASWSLAGRLRPGDTIDQMGHRVLISATKIIDADAFMWDLTVEGTHTFEVSGSLRGATLIVHNNGGDEQPGVGAAEGVEACAAAIDGVVERIEGVAAGGVRPGASWVSTPPSGGGVIAEVDDHGILNLAIARGPDTGSGAEMFNEALSEVGPVNGIRGSWGTSMPSNLDAFNANIRGGMSVDEAARGTFTGTMAGRAGFGNVVVEQLIGSPGEYSNVKVVFVR